MDLIARYIKHGRFGTFVEGFIQAEYEHKKAEAEKNQEWMLWTAYIHSYSEKSFEDWKMDVLKTEAPQTASTSDHHLTDEGVKAIITQLFPSQTSPGK